MFRIFHEMKNQDKPGWFVTLTYEEKYVRRAPGGLSLRFRDVQLMLKKLRKAKYYAKYICVGEYGTKTARPHYHLLLWTDCPSMSIQNYWTTRKGEMFGQVHIGRITLASAMYTLKYIIQPKQHTHEGIEKTRAQFSQGLGLSYLTSNVYHYHTVDYDDPIFMSRIEGKLVALPRYYKYKIFTKYQLRKENARIRDKHLKDETKQYKKLRAQGVKNIRPYLQGLRETQAKYILRSSKFNQTI